MRYRVVLFLPSLAGGGAEKYMVTLAAGLSNAGVGVSLVLAEASGPYLSQVSESVQVVDLQTAGVWRAMPRLIRYIQQTRPAALISALDRANIVALLAERLSGADVPVIVTTHTMVSHAARSSDRIARKAIPILMNLLYPVADAVVGVSDAVADDLSLITGLPRESIRTIYNPVPIPQVVALAREPLANTWLESEAAPFVISVGNLWPDKDHETLLRAFRIARQRRPLRLVILGDGPERPALLRLIEELGLQNSVFMPGFVTNPYPWIARSAVFVLPSRREGLSTALIEAMALGITPVAARSLGGVNEVLRDGECGLLTPIGDAEAMADAMLTVLERPIDPRVLRERARAFSVANAVRAYTELITTLAE